MYQDLAEGFSSSESACSKVPMLCPSHGSLLSEGEKLPSTHGILLQLLQSRKLLQEKYKKVTLYTLFVTPHCVPQYPVLYEIQGPWNVTPG